MTVSSDLGFVSCGDFKGAWDRMHSCYMCNAVLWLHYHDHWGDLTLPRPHQHIGHWWRLVLVLQLSQSHWHPLTSRWCCGAPLRVFQYGPCVKSFGLLLSRRLNDSCTLIAKCSTLLQLESNESAAYKRLVWESMNWEGNWSNRK